MDTIIKLIVILGILNCSKTFSQYYIGGNGDGYASDTSAYFSFCKPVEIISQSTDISSCTNDYITLNISSSGNLPVSYQWQENNGIAWINLTNQGTYSGTTNDTLLISGVNYISNGYYYRCIVVNDCGSDTSNPIKLNVFQQFADTVIYSICDGDTFNFNGHNYSSDGYYTDTLLSVNGCDSIITTNLIVNQLPQISITKTDASCYAASNGTATAVINVGTAPFTYLWNNGSYQDIITDLLSGNYTLTVSDVYGCKSTNFITINQPTPIVIGITTLSTGCDSSNGIAASIVSGGTPPYTYNWSTGDSISIIQNLIASSYTLTVTDANTCEKVTIAYVNNTGALSLDIQNINNITCFNNADGAIDISISGGKSPYVYEWSNGASTQDISEIPAGTYEITVTDSLGCVVATNIEISQPEELKSIITLTNASCGNSDGSAIVSVIGGTSPYTYLWSTYDTTAIISGLPAGAYSIVINDANNCVKMNNVAISNDNGPVVSSANISSSSCYFSNGSIDITISGGSLPFTYNWSDSTFNEDLTNIQAGDYSLTITDNNGCLTVGNYTVSPQLPLENPICIVLVDSILNKNKIVWEKVQTSGISHYNLYKETTATGLYQFLVSVPYNDLSEYIDPFANPLIRPWRYRISAVDSCGNESPFSEAHKTLHLTVNQGLNQTVNLIWDKYEGFPYYSYYIFRHLNSGGWQILDTLPSTVWTYVDIPDTSGKFTYVVTVEKDFPCISTGLDKALGGPYSHSISNLDETSIAIAITKIWAEPSYGIIIYPNPTNDKINIEFDNEKDKDYTLQIYNVTGQVVLKQEKVKTNNFIVDIKKLKSGYYTIELKGEKIFRGKVLRR
ncbi:MAG: hypothetical protein A2046_00710 [Bacteroidetes bacterium GWA2_30_7]|nr:MAG: hypothetical protein A2046_00710 [Bacteroidetes bacterium GWA2_30_7]